MLHENEGINPERGNIQTQRGPGIKGLNVNDGQKEAPAKGQEGGPRPAAEQLPWKDPAWMAAEGWGSQAMPSGDKSVTDGLVMCQMSGVF